MLDSFESQPAAISRGMVKKKSSSPASRMPAELEEQAERLKRLREMLGFDTSASFATGFLHISAQRWNHFENGKPLSREIVFQLVRSVPGLTSDWLYFGNADGLPVALARRLGELGPPGKRTTA